MNSNPDSRRLFGLCPFMGNSMTAPPFVITLCLQSLSQFSIQMTALGSKSIYINFSSRILQGTGSNALLRFRDMTSTHSLHPVIL
jgi:hypothetical protein